MAGSSSLLSCCPDPAPGTTAAATAAVTRLLPEGRVKISSVTLSAVLLQGVVWGGAQQHQWHQSAIRPEGLQREVMSCRTSCLGICCPYSACMLQTLFWSHAEDNLVLCSVSLFQQLELWGLRQLLLRHVMQQFIRIIDEVTRSLCKGRPADARTAQCIGKQS